MQSSGVGGESIKVLLVGEDPLARAGLQALLTGDPGVVVVAQAGEAAGFGSALHQHAPDVVVWDVGSHAGGANARMDQVPPDAPPVLMLVTDDVVGRQVSGSGVRGVVYRDAHCAALLAAIHAVAQGFHVLEQDVMTSLLPQRDENALPAEELTAREREVLTLLVEGLSNKSIGTRLNISEHTAKFHVNGVLQKLGVQRRSEAVARALRLGLVVF